MKKLAKVVGSKSPSLLSAMKMLERNQYYHANQMSFYRDNATNAPKEVQTWLAEQELIALRSHVHIMITLRKLKETLKQLKDSMKVV